LGSTATHILIPFNSDPALVPSGNVLTLTDWTGNSSNTYDVVGGGSFSGSDVTGNTVTISGSSSNIKGLVAGGVGMNSANVKDNTVTVTGGSVALGVNGGLATSTGSLNITVSGNKVTLGTGATVSSGDSYGGYLVNSAATGGTGTVSGNEIHVDGATLNSTGIGGGGIDGYGSVTGNTVTVKNATGAKNVHGGVVFATKDSTASGNTITLENSDTSGNVRGGYIQTQVGETVVGHADGNTVTLTASSAQTIGGDVEGGYVSGGGSSSGNTANLNTVEIENYAVTDAIFGGHVKAADTGEARANEVTLKGATEAKADVFGGFTGTGDAEGNEVILNGSAKVSGTGNIYGGVTYKGDVEGNSVILNGSAQVTSSGNIYGGHVGNNGDGDATGNSVTLNNSAIVSGGGNIYGGFVSKDGDAEGNSVNLNGSAQVTGANAIIYGAYAASGNAGGNSVTLDGSAQVTGANAIIYGAYAASGDAEGNSVTLDGSAVVSGANAIIYGAYAASGDASGNTLLIQDNATIDGLLVGGYVGSTGKAINNTLTIRGNPNLQNAVIKLGDSSGSATDVFTGNTLIVEADDTVTVKSVANVQNFEFLLPATLNGTAALVATDSITFGDGGGGKSKVTSIAMAGGGPVPTSLVLFSAPNIDFSDLETGTGQLFPGQKGVTLLYDLEVDGNGNATVTNKRAHPQAKALSEGYLSGFALVNQSVDLAANQGLDAARTAANLGHQAFAAISGGSSRYETGSHINVDGYALLAGLSGKLKLDPGTLTLGAFVAYGDGDYDTHNSVGNASVKGKGDTEHTGLGVLARLDFTGTNAGNPYAEASLQGGRVKSDFHSGNIVDTYTGRSARYHTRSGYQSFHLGAGYVGNVGQSSEFDLYGKYLYSRRGSDSVTLNTDDPVKFSAVESQRLRFGGRYSWTIDNLKPYVGLAWEHEFDGKAKATTYDGVKIDAPDLKGGTGIVEIGLTLKASKTQPLSIDLGLQGYAGTRQGGSGSVKVKYAF
jgi:hypothetical protein